VVLVTTWNVLAPDDRLPYDSKAIVARSLSHGRDVTIGYPGWGYQNNKVTHWTPLPKHVVDERRGWLSEYWGDALPSKDDWYLVSCDWKPGYAEKCGPMRPRVDKHWYDKKKGRFLAISTDMEVLAWRPFPKPPKVTS
jgi:hypothetical protein